MIPIEVASWGIITICSLSWIVYAVSHFRVEKWDGPWIEVPRYTSADAHIKAEDRRRYGRG